MLTALQHVRGQHGLPPAEHSLNLATLAVQGLQTTCQGVHACMPAMRSHARAKHSALACHACK
eukprot:1499153-Lingulodinium_polyedra.AAC.1